MFRSRCCAMQARKEGSSCARPGRAAAMLSQIWPHAPYRRSWKAWFTRAAGSQGAAQNSSRRQGRLNCLRAPKCRASIPKTQSRLQCRRLRPAALAQPRTDAADDSVMLCLQLRLCVHPEPD